MATPILTIMATAAKTTTATVEASNFENNAFIDFAPLLTLFGEEITKQFLSISVGLADNILVGIAPISIMMVIISVIRISRGKFLKLLIERYSTPVSFCEIETDLY